MVQVRFNIIFHRLHSRISKHKEPSQGWKSDFYNYVWLSLCQRKGGADKCHSANTGDHKYPQEIPIIIIKFNIIILLVCWFWQPLKDC